MTWKLTLGGGFMVASVFWAGSTYNRVVGIEASLQDIRAQLPALGKVAVLEQKQTDMQWQMDRMQAQLDKVKRIVE
jgi:hypothetical protein